MLAQQLYDGTQYAKEGAKVVSTQAHKLFRNLNVIASHISGYPKIIYVPFLILTSAAYGFHSVKKTKSPHLTPDLAAQETPLNDLSAFKKWVVTSTIENITDVIASKEVKKEGISYLEKMFKNSQVHDSLIVLLKGAVKDDRFVTESKKYGIDWITYTITSQ